MIAALPPGHRAEREAAYRSLFARCSRLLAQDRDQLAETARTLRTDRQAASPEFRAEAARLANRPDAMEALAADAFNASDPAGIASLSGLAGRMVALADSGDADAALRARARDVDAALPWAACDLGLDCGAQSLWALQLCAAEGLCEGDVPARLSARDAAAGIDPAEVQEQRTRLVGLLRSGRALRSSDLLGR